MNRSMRCILVLCLIGFHNFTVGGLGGDLVQGKICSGVIRDATTLAGIKCSYHVRLSKSSRSRSSRRARFLRSNSFLIASRAICDLVEPAFSASFVSSESVPSSNLTLSCVSHLMGRWSQVGGGWATVHYKKHYILYIKC